MNVVAVVCSAGSIALIAFTLGTHRVRIALWHQSADAPDSIVTYGAYAHIRHPFYTAFLLALLASLLVCPSIGTMSTLLAGLAALTITAIREERRLKASTFGAEYSAYMRRTGRFWPRMVGVDR